MNLSNNILFWLFSIYIFILPHASHAEVLAVSHAETGLFSNSNPTQTFLWKGDRARATLVMIPGGEGHLGLSMDKTDLGGFYGRTLKPLSNSNATSGLFHVVIFDSPTALAVGDSYPTSRATASHLSRIEDVVQFYKEKFNKPVWLMGHSNGAVSVTEFYKYLQKKHKENMVSGIIFSSGRNGAGFNSDTNLAVLFLAHEKDDCAKSTPASSLREYNELKKYNKQKTVYVLIKSGESEPQNACRSGYHMFFNAHEEVYKAIDNFASDNINQNIFQ